MLYSGSQASLIRNLSVFISHLELTARPEQESSTYFNRTAAVFTRILDEILEPRLKIPAPYRDSERNFDVDFDRLFFLGYGWDSTAPEYRFWGIFWSNAVLKETKMTSLKKI